MKANSTTFAKYHLSVTLFRFLKRAKYSVPSAVNLLLSTIRWRIENHVDALSYKTLPREFFAEPFFFFHKTDRLQRPIALLNVRYLPKFNSGSEYVGEHGKDGGQGTKDETQGQKLRRFAIFGLEMARKLTWDLTRERERRRDLEPLVMHFILLIDLKNAGFLAMVGVLLFVCSGSYC